MIPPLSSNSCLPSAIASTASSCAILRHLPYYFPTRLENFRPLTSSFHKLLKQPSHYSSSISALMPTFRMARVLSRSKSSSIIGKGGKDITFMGCSSFKLCEADQPGRMDSVGKTPVLLFDVMGTIVRDPFYDDVPAFFGITMKELLAIKHPTAWIEFEKGLITEEELIYKFFSDQRDFDCNGLKNCMTSGYAYLEGVEGLLDRLKSSGYQMHAFTNYPLWYNMIEDKLKLSKYLTWTFVSCHTGKRKPDPEAYIEAANQLELSPSNIIFIDDQSRNVEAATRIGMTGLAFQDAKKLEKDLLSLGIVF